ncbi:MAG: hypothetical protein EX269_15965 [Acidimicrobiales bacterium]|nr:MAG: hypothetical protein EX269_15965 [Acidimicrobiales bacterium]
MRERIVLVAAVVLLVAVFAGSWVALRDESVNAGPAPDLPDYQAPTSLVPPADAQTTEPLESSEEDTTGETAPATVESSTTQPPVDTTTVGPGEDYALLQNAIRDAQPGDIIEVIGGTHPHQVVPVKGTFDAWIQIRASEGTSPIIAVEGEFPGFEVTQAEFIEISGFEIDGPPTTVSGAGVRIWEDSHHIRVANNVIHGFPGSGVEVIESGSVAVVGNEIFDNSARSPYQTSGIAFFKPFGDDGDGFENIIAGNKVYRNENLVPNPVHGITDGNCIIIDNTRWPRSDYEYPGETLIENNVCFDNGGRGIHVLKADDVYIVNNTLIQNLRTTEIIGGELSADDARNVIFQNNLVWARDPDDSAFLLRSESVAFENNGYVIADGGGGDVEDSAIILTDAGLVNSSLDPLEFDPRLAAGSAALGAGRSEGAPSVTFDGDTRPTTPSLGALEMAPS